MGLRVCPRGRACSWRRRTRRWPDISARTNPRRRLPASRVPHGPRTRKVKTVTTTTPLGRTHEVLNQVPPLVGHDVAEDPVLLEALSREGADWYAEDLHRLGR